MNVTNVANILRHGYILQKNTPFGRPPVNDTLNRLSENLLTAREQAKDMKTRFDTLELSAEAAEGMRHSALEEVPEELLRFYLNQCKVGANLSRHHEASLMEYRDRLSAFDQTIQEYQDMLDGKTALPEQLQRDDVTLLLEATRAAREQFLQQGAEKLNRFSRETPTPKDVLGSAYSIISGRAANAKDDSRWQLDPSANDIYGEIDRALASARDVTSTFQDGAAGILAELKRRGCVQAVENLTLGVQNSAYIGAAARESLFKDIYDGLWDAFKQSIGSGID